MPPTYHGFCPDSIAPYFWIARVRGCTEFCLGYLIPFGNTQFPMKLSLLAARVEVLGLPPVGEPSYPAGRWLS